VACPYCPQVAAVSPPDMAHSVEKLPSIPNQWQTNPNISERIAEIWASITAGVIKAEIGNRLLRETFYLAQSGTFNLAAPRGNSLRSPLKKPVRL
jgi:hypothetical protein